MGITMCRYCGSSDLATKEIEIRRINALTMKIASRQSITELHCRHCGWSVEQETPYARWRPMLESFSNQIKSR